MPGYSDEIVAVEKRFDTQWTSIGGGVPVAYSAAEFTPPAEGSWVELCVLSGQGNDISLGPNPRIRYPGIIHVDIFTRDRQGEKPSRDLAEKVSTILENVDILCGSSGIIRTQATSYIPVGVVDGVFHAVVSTEYRRDNL